MITTISPQELSRLQQTGKPVRLIDVRTPAEFREVHIDFAENLPLDRLDPTALPGPACGTADQPLYVVCRSGNRAKQACEKLVAAGVSNVVNVEGGTLAYEAAGLPVVRGQKTISLERQVRIAAGALVLTGAILGLFVHPYWIALSAFVGAGLMFAGITDTCGMGMLLARMPWNQVSGSPSSAGAACRVGAALLATVVLAPATTLAVEHTRDSLAMVKQSVSQQKAVLVDVREKDEWQDGHLRDARLLPLSDLEQGIAKETLARVLPKDKVIYLHCAFGGRCVQAAKILKKQGYDVRPLKSSFDALLDAGFPAAN